MTFFKWAHKRTKHAHRSKMNDDIYSTCGLGFMDLPVALMLFGKKSAAIYWLVYPAPIWE